MRVALFVDGANFFYMQKKLGWHVDVKKLFDYCKNYGELVDAYFYASIDNPMEPQQQRYIDALISIGYTVITKQVKSITDHATGEIFKKANLDTEIVLDMFNSLELYDMVVLVSGDSDFERALMQLRARGKRFKVMSTLGMVAYEIRQVAGMHFVDLAALRTQLMKPIKPYTGPGMSSLA